MADLVLASASPRRRELLDQIGVKYICAPQDLDESVKDSETPQAYVERLAREKAISGAQNTHLPVLGSDTSVVLNGQILTKPTSKQDAQSMLMALSGQTHEVLSGVALCHINQGQPHVTSLVVKTQVRFIELQPALIERYIATEEPMDKAGAYGIQGKAAVFVDAIEGSYSNVVGLPLKETAQLLARYQVPIWC